MRKVGESRRAGARGLPGERQSEALSEFHRIWCPEGATPALQFRFAGGEDGQWIGIFLDRPP